MPLAGRTAAPVWISNLVAQRSMVIVETNVRKGTMAYIVPKITDASK